MFNSLTSEYGVWFNIVYKFDYHLIKWSRRSIVSRKVWSDDDRRRLTPLYARHRSHGRRSHDRTVVSQSDVPDTVTFPTNQANISKKYPDPRPDPDSRPSRELDLTTSHLLPTAQWAKKTVVGTTTVIAVGGHTINHNVLLTSLNSVIYGCRLRPFVMWRCRVFLPP